MTTQNNHFMNPHYLYAVCRRSDDQSFYQKTWPNRHDGYRNADTWFRGRVGNLFPIYLATPRSTAYCQFGYQTAHRRLLCSFDKCFHGNKVYCEFKRTDCNTVTRVEQIVERGPHQNQVTYNAREIQLSTASDHCKRINTVYTQLSTASDHCKRINTAYTQLSTASDHCKSINTAYTQLSTASDH